MKVKLSAFIFSAVSALFCLCGCNSESTIDPTPRDVTGVLKYTGATYAPFHAPQPYNFAIYNVDNRFVAYVDTTKLVLPRMDAYRDRLVEIRGTIVKEEGDTVLRAESIRIKR